MPSSTELLLEQINELKSEITSAKLKNTPHDHLEERLSQLLGKLSAAATSLNENAQILKG